MTESTSPLGLEHLGDFIKCLIDAKLNRGGRVWFCGNGEDYYRTITKNTMP